jgi:hypothetical protein
VGLPFCFRGTPSRHKVRRVNFRNFAPYKTLLLPKVVLHVKDRVLFLRFCNEFSRSGGDIWRLESLRQPGGGSNFSPRVTPPGHGVPGRTSSYGGRVLLCLF